MQKVDNLDVAADALADRIGGEARVKFSNDPSGREFDVVSDDYISQAKPDLKSYGKSWRNQTKATFEAKLISSLREHLVMIFCEKLPNMESGMELTMLLIVHR